MRTVHSMHPTPLVTAAELERMGSDFRYELVEGRLVPMSPVGTPHALVASRLLVMLAQHVRTHKLGFAVTELGCKLAVNPDTVRAPDVAFVRQASIPVSGIPRGFWAGPPDLAVEVLSPDDRPSEITEKVSEYLTSGVCLVWVIDPDERTVTTYRRLGAPSTFTVEDTLD